jgi:hypothetical protein
MRTDGTITYWQFQYNYWSHDSGKPAKWVEIGGQVEACGFHKKTGPRDGSHNPLWQEHTASGKCWQRHGYHGFLSVKEAMKALPLVTKCYRAYEVRIVKITKSQHTEECLLVRRKQVA